MSSPFRLSVLAVCALAALGTGLPVGDASSPFVSSAWAQSAVAPKAKAKEGTAPAAAPAKPATEAAEKGTAHDPDEKWQVIYMGKSRVGYGRSKISNLERDGKPLRLSETEAVLVINRFGQTIKMKTLLRMEEGLDGEVQRFDLEVHNPPSASTRTSGLVIGDKVALSNEVNGKAKTTELKWDTAIRGPGWIELELRKNPLKPNETRTYTTFDPQFSKPDTVTIKTKDFKKVPLLGDESRELLEAKVSHSVFAGVQTTDYYTAEGESLKSVMSLLQTTSYAVPKEEALKALTGGELDLGLSTLVRLEKPLKNAQQTKRVVYRVTAPGLDPKELFKAGEPQAMKILKEDTAEITVRSIREPQPVADAKEPGPEFLASNAYIQCDDPKVMEFASQATGDETDPWKTAVQMEKWVYENLKKKNFSTLLASAAETAKTLSGDCTEHSVLLVAMARAKKIPARAVVGLLYVPSLNAFGGHMWSEVYVGGQWIPLDATLGKGFAAAERIKFGETSFDGLGNAPLEDFLSMAATLGNLQIEVLESE